MASSKPIKIDSGVHAKLKSLCVRLNLDMGWVASNILREGIARAERLKTLPMGAAFSDAKEINQESLNIAERVRIALDGLLSEREEVAHWELLKVRGMGVLKKDIVRYIQELGNYEKIWITSEKDAGFGWKKKVL